MTIAILLIIGNVALFTAAATLYLVCKSMDRLSERLDRLATAWEKDDDDDGDNWKRTKQ